MNTTPKVSEGTLDERRDLLLSHLISAGYERAEPAILQPASVFLDLSGEEIRSRLFLTSDHAGHELCLRPEYTIPVCKDYLASASRGQPMGFSYLGKVFRSRPQTSGESTQAGIESFGRMDREAADAEVLTLALEAVLVAGGPKLSVTLEIGRAHV